MILDFKGPGTTAAAVTVHSGLLWIDGGVRAKAEILNPFQRRVGFIPRKKRDHECDDGDDQGQMFHQRQPKHLGTQFGTRVRQCQSYAQTPVRSPAFGLQNRPFRRTTVRK